jgi:hypothetical protein
LRVQAITRGSIGAALALAAAAAALVLWPVHANGVSGTALWPHYADFGWTSYAPLPTHPTVADLRAAGVAFPQDLVRHRRHVAEVLAVASLLAVGVAGAARIARRGGRAPE